VNERVVELIFELIVQARNKSTAIASKSRKYLSDGVVFRHFHGTGAVSRV